MKKTTRPTPRFSFHLQFAQKEQEYKLLAQEEHENDRFTSKVALLFDEQSKYYLVLNSDVFDGKEEKFQYAFFPKRFLEPPWEEDKLTFPRERAGHFHWESVGEE